MTLLSNAGSAVVEIFDDVIHIVEKDGHEYEIDRHSREWLDCVSAYQVACGDRVVDVGRDRNLTVKEIKAMADRIDTIREDASKPQLVLALWAPKQLLEVFTNRGTYVVRTATNNKIVLTRISDLSPQMIGITLGLSGEPMPDPVGEERKKKFAAIFHPKTGARTHAEAERAIQAVRENYADAFWRYFGQPGDTAETAPPALWLVAYEMLQRLAAGRAMLPEAAQLARDFFLSKSSGNPYSSMS